MEFFWLLLIWKGCSRVTPICRSIYSINNFVNRHLSLQVIYMWMNMLNSFAYLVCKMLAISLAVCNLYILYMTVQGLIHIQFRFRHIYQTFLLFVLYIYNLRVSAWQVQLVFFFAFFVYIFRRVGVDKWLSEATSLYVVNNSEK